MSFVTVGVIFLTMIFNGMTIKFLIKYLDVTKTNKIAASIKKSL